jgi:hypothetical protein
MESAEVSEAYAAARALLERAEQDAARIRGEADRYRRQREQEAELLVAKARRLLAAAELRAASISRAAATAPPAPNPGGGEAAMVVDLPAAEAPEGDGQAHVIPTGLDRMLQSAIERAVDGSYQFGR